LSLLAKTKERKSALFDKKKRVSPIVKICMYKTTCLKSFSKPSLCSPWSD